jgi:hypothetical protein
MGERLQKLKGRFLALVKEDERVGVTGQEAETQGRLYPSHFEGCRRTDQPSVADWLHSVRGRIRSRGPKNLWTKECETMRKASPKGLCFAGGGGESSLIKSRSESLDGVDGMEPLMDAVITGSVGSL